MASIFKDPDYLQRLDACWKANKAEVVILPLPGKKPMTHWLINHDCSGQLWCGPAVISALTGEPTSVARDLVKKYRKDPVALVQGTSEEEIEFALDRLGYKLEHAYLYGGRDWQNKPTFSHWLHKTTKERVDNVGYLISLSGTKVNNAGHWALVMNGVYICSFTSYWVTLEKARFRKRKVEAVYAVRKK
jgi:ketosteroid isomerase-like protein